MKLPPMAVISLFDNQDKEEAMSGEYAKAGVDYRVLKLGKQAMSLLIPQTRSFPLAHREVEVSETGSWRYVGRRRTAFYGPLLESLGTKNWIAEWMYRKTGDPKYFAGIGQDVVEMAVMDLLRHGALPFAGADLIAVADGAWFEDEPRMHALVDGFHKACQMNAMALVGGETPALKLLIAATVPVGEAPIFAFAANGIITPFWREIIPRIHAGAQIVGVGSSGPHANGYSLLTKVGLALPNQFLHEIAPGRIFGEEALAPTRSYARFMERVLRGPSPLAVIPATGGGLGKLAVDRKPFTYVIKHWPMAIPMIFKFLLQVGKIPLPDLLSSFNWGIGLYLIVDESDVDRLLALGKILDYPVYHLGCVEDGEPRTIAHTSDGVVTIYPPGD